MPRPSCEPKASDQAGVAAQGQIGMAGQFEYAGVGSTGGFTAQAKALELQEKHPKRGQLAEAC